MLLTKEDLHQLLDDVRDDGWIRAANVPPAGQRVDVMHVLNRNYDCDGEVDDSGHWHCSSGFILPNGVFTFNPTHWRAKSSEVAA
jgi:hypothetical protein